MNEVRDPNPMKCPRCETDLQYQGTKEFHEGPGGGFFSDWTELFMNKERFDVYVCPRCAACTREKEYTTLKRVPSKRLGMGPGGGEGCAPAKGSTLGSSRFRQSGWAGVPAAGKGRSIRRP